MPNSSDSAQSFMVDRLVIFGATGDVVSRLFLPALVGLVQESTFPRNLSITAIARKSWSTEQYHQHVRETFRKQGTDVESDQLEYLFSCIQYAQVEDLSHIQRVQEALGSSPFVAYLALPPSTFSMVLNTIKQIGIPQGSRIIFEKPFGENFGSARTLNYQAHQIFPEEQVFRIDHFLGKQTVRNILGLRFGNRIFEPIWNQHHIENVEIIWDETLALEGRVGYYDKAGALKDMIQNHLLQLMCLIGMEPPISFNDRDFRDRKVDLLRAVRSLTPDEVKQQTVRAQYDAGTINGKAIPAYKDEDGVDADRGTETYAEIKLWIDSWRWAGVPFVLRSGKALGKDRKEVLIHFKDVPYLAFGESKEIQRNILRLQFSPDSLNLSLNLNGAGDPFQLNPAELKSQLAPQDTLPYGDLFLNVLANDPILFIRADEVEELWRIIEPIQSGWEQDQVPLFSYPAGSLKPKDSFKESH
ncbi:glucose-6-phosphate dehydrogenase [Candidatus Nitronereus thalassa]|uniref:Glucose-6-phosphate 1-dehydrogenase n=1 Tax=Candidatus Nitronereus thalassa TaxID=3020898 RepID=A0ABU3KBJ3_9BACT|nr:glucose-6-phosphate dehydrogenase [Candidatus Nitronereus thalassa]MDT7043773.1 glucose-6-phosphate dehydrogenase [Candidatus Nitronereus thalassa]